MSDEMKTLFREGAIEHLGELEEAILKLGEMPTDMAEIDRLFRVMHTIKGSAGMVGLDDVSAFAHQLESEFDLIRQGKSEFTPAMLDLALLSRDQMMAMIDAHFGGPPADPECSKELIAEIRSHQKQGPAQAVQADQELLKKGVAELPRLMGSAAALTETAERLQQVLLLSRRLNIQCLEEFLREFQEDFANAARLGRLFPPEAWTIAAQAGQEAIQMLTDTLAPPPDDIDPMKIMEALERPLSIKAAWQAIRPRFTDMPGRPRTFRILVPCPGGNVPSGVPTDLVLEKLKEFGPIRLLQRVLPTVPDLIPTDGHPLAKEEAA
ncbi:MAG TPA: Hpt domain-containing protein [Candidatus Ozemobacteraceae bacterium]